MVEPIILRLKSSVLTTFSKIFRYVQNDPKKYKNVGLKPNLRIQNDEKVTKKTNKQQKTALDEDGF